MQQRGSAAITGVLVMMLLGLMGAGYIALSRTEVNISADFRDGVAAQYLAEAGARRALMELYSNPAWTGLSEQMGSVNSATRGRYTVAVSTPVGEDTRRLVTSTGQVNRARRQVVFYANVQTAGGGGTVYDNAIFAGSSMIVHNKANIIGATRSDGSLELKNGSQVNGDVIVHGAYTDHGAILSHEPIRNAATIDFPIFNAAEYRQNAVLLPPADDKNYELSGGTYTGKYYYDDEKKPLTINSSSQKPVKGIAIIYATGDVVIGPNSVVGDGSSNYFLIIAEGNITVHSNVQLERVVLIALGDIDIDADVQLTGAAIAKNNLIIKGGGSSATTIKWDSGIMNYWELPTSGDRQPFSIDPYKPYKVTQS